MMKRSKIVLTVVAVVLLLVLTVPIPTGIARDGGTRTYTALSYKIVVWNHFYENDEGVILKYQKTRVYLYPQSRLSLDELFDSEQIFAK